jgi:hypothetical protein
MVKKESFEVILFHPTRRRFRLAGRFIGVVTKQDFKIRIKISCIVWYICSLMYHHQVAGDANT